MSEEFYFAQIQCQSLVQNLILPRPQNKLILITKSSKTNITLKSHLSSVHSYDVKKVQERGNKKTFLQCLVSTTDAVVRFVIEVDESACQRSWHFGC